MLSALLNTTAPVPGKMNSRSVSQIPESRPLSDTQERENANDTDFSKHFENLSKGTEKLKIGETSSAPADPGDEIEVEFGKVGVGTEEGETLLIEPQTAPLVSKNSNASEDVSEDPQVIAVEEGGVLSDQLFPPFEAGPDQLADIGDFETGGNGRDADEGGNMVNSLHFPDEAQNDIGLETRPDPDRSLPIQAGGVAQEVQILKALPSDTLAAQNFGLSVSKAAREQQEARFADRTHELSKSANVDPKPLTSAPPLKPFERSEHARFSEKYLDGLTSEAMRPETFRPAIPQGLSAQEKLQIQAVVQASTGPTPSLFNETSSTLHSVGDSPFEMAWDTSRSHSVSGAPAVMRAEMPVHIARQMAEVLQRMPDKPIELTLNPLELGHVRMSISTAETGIIVNVLAERIETLDLMRRHIDQLAQELQSMGYENISFSFGEGARRSDGDETSDQNQNFASQHESSPHEVAVPSQIVLPLATVGLDIRL